MGNIVFEKAPRQTEDWEDVTIDEVRQVTTPEEREQMIFQKAIVRTDRHKYRRKVPTNPKDWSKK